MFGRRLFAAALVALSACATPDATQPRPLHGVVADALRPELKIVLVSAFTRPTIFGIFADGSIQEQIIFAPSGTFNIEPAVSRDGTRILFTSNRDGNNEIYVMARDGSSQTRLTTNTVSDGKAAWSPDGQQVVFASNRSGSNQLHTMAADGSSVAQITTEGINTEPKWSPDGQRIAFRSTRNGASNIYVVNPDGTAEVQLTTDGASVQPAWSPDGRQIVFARTVDGKQDVWIMEADGANAHAITGGPFSEDNREPAWSPDGTTIAFISTRDRNPELYTMLTDGSSLRRLTQTGWLDATPSWMPPPKPLGELRFVTQPPATVACCNAPMSPPVQVGVFDSLGNLMTDASIPVSLELDARPDGVGLKFGQRPIVQSVNGIATFDNLVVDRAATGMVFNATSAGYTGVQSTPFNSTAPYRLVFITEPSEVEVGELFNPRIQVAIVDSSGAIVTDHPTIINLGGFASTQTTVAGVATFPDAVVWSPGNALRYVARASGAASATSAAFHAKLSFVTMDAGDSHVCGATAPGWLFCWGSNTFHEVHFGTPLFFPTPVSAGSRFALNAIAAGANFSCRRADPGRAWCWGRNDSWQLGHDTGVTSTDEVVGGFRFASLTAGREHTCGVTTSAAAYCWGDGAFGKRGNGSFDDVKVPAPVSGLDTGIAMLAAGGDHTCGLTTTATLYCWGNNTFGQIGDGTSGHDGYAVPRAIRFGVDFTSISAGTNYTCGLNSLGAAFCWGRNASGELGNGKTTDRSIPTAVAGGLRFSRIAAGDAHTCAITLGGAIHCWGRNAEGQLGDGTTTQQLRPVPVIGTDGLVFVSVSVGLRFSCGLTDGNAMYCWGANDFGQLGNGSLTGSAMPVRVIQ